MYCPKCGKEINDEAVICVGCGCQVKQKAEASADVQENKPVRESSSTANCALLFAFLFPVVGLVMGIIGSCRYKTPMYKNRCITAIVVSVIVWIVLFIASPLLLGM